LSDIVVSNSSPLIYLAKLNRLTLLRSLFSDVSIPSEVYNEVVRKGKQHGFLEVKCVERAIEEGWMKVREAKRERKLLMFQELDLGEVEVLSLAIQLKASLVLIDDASGRLVAEALGLNSKGTVYVILKAARAGAITKGEAKNLITELISAGFWISSEIVGKILNELG
jgi:predicted nucleic acid-binding protein